MADDEEENSGLGGMLGNLMDGASDGEFNGHDRQDSYTEVTHQGWFSRLFGSIFSAMFGVVIFFGSFAVLYWNEGAVDDSKLAKNAVEVNAASPSSGAVGKFVAATGPLKTSAQLGDEYLKAGNYVTLSRTAEMYAWVEQKSEKKEKKVGGGEKTITTYDYERRWDSSPSSSNSFKVKSGHFNPEMRVKSDSWKAESASLGALKVKMDAITLPGGNNVALSDETVKTGDPNGGYLYVGGARSGQPRVGDVRVSYTALTPGGEYTVLGKLTSTSAIAPMKVEKRDFYRLFEGTKADALKQLSFEYSMWIWGFRLLGFLMCWGGMRMFMEPLNTLFDVLPFLGSMGRGLTGFITFPIALVLTLVTIVVAQIMHNLIAMIVVGILVVVGCVMLFGKKKGGAAKRATA